MKGSRLLQIVNLLLACLTLSGTSVRPWGARTGGAVVDAGALAHGMTLVGALFGRSVFWGAFSQRPS